MNDIFIIGFILFVAILLNNKINRVKENFTPSGNLEVDSIHVKDKIYFNKDDTHETYIKSWTLGGGGILVQTKSGNVGIGARNTGFLHIYTDRPKFAFNRPLWDVQSRPYKNLLSGTDIEVDNIHVKDKIYFNKGDTRGETYLKSWSGTGGGVLVQTKSGNVGIGSLNTSFLHIYSDRGKFAFNKRIWDVDGRPYKPYFRDEEITVLKDDNNNKYLNLPMGLKVTGNAEFTNNVNIPTERLNISQTNLENQIREVYGNEVDVKHLIDIHK